jgi:phage terminase large subunit GpA-like protein
MDFLAFDGKAGRGHVMRWPDGKPELAHFVCRGCAQAINETHKYAMLEAGGWVPESSSDRHASFHIWAAYSMSPNATWGKIAAEFLEAKRRPETLRTFVNTVLGETWKERGEAPEWERLYERREGYAIGTVPVDPLCITAGVDVQKNRLIFEVVAWLGDKQSYSIDAGALLGDTADKATWLQLDALLNRSFCGPDGLEHHIRLLAIDSGYNTQMVYDWARQHPITRVIACKGVSGARSLVGSASPVDVTVSGRRIQRGYRVYPIGVDLAKSELYGWLRMQRGDGYPPPGYCHFPEYEGDFFKQLTAEHLVTVTNRRTGRAAHAWHVLPNRENHYLDCRILARVAAAVLGIDRATPRQPTPATPTALQAEVVVSTTQQRSRDPRRSGWLGGGLRIGQGRGWLKKP